MAFEHFTVFATGPKCKKFKGGAVRGSRECCVSMCGSIDDGRCSFHGFPKPGVKIAIRDRSGEVYYCDRRKVWEDRVGDEVRITKRSMVCSVHFVEEDYKENSRLKASYRRLQPTAVPSLYLPEENGAFCQFNRPKLLAKSFLNYLSNTNNDTFGKSVKVRKKKSQSFDKEESSLLDDDIVLNQETRASAILEGSSSSEEHQDVTDVQQTESDVEDLSNENTTLTTEEGDVPDANTPQTPATSVIIEDIVEISTDSDRTVEDTDSQSDDQDVEVEDDEQKAEIVSHDLKCEDGNDAAETSAQKKAHVDDYEYIDIIMMHTNFELEKLKKAGIYVPYTYD